MHGVSDTEPLLDVYGGPAGQHQHLHVVDGPDGQDRLRVRAGQSDRGPDGQHQHQHVVGQRDRLDNVYVLDRTEAKNMEYYWTEEWRGAVGEEGEQGQLKAEEPGEWK